MDKDPGWQFLRLPLEKLLKEQSRPYDIKKNVWVPDPEEGYAAGEIVSTKDDSVTLTVNGAQKVLKKDLCQEMNPPKFEKTEDMSNLTFLNDASVLYNLRSRYAAMLIYTYSGLFCVVINPYKRLPIYTESVARMYMGKRRNEMPPHLFAVSDEAYRNMLQNKENQSMLITGESGAGKTENTKKVIAYFASVGASQQQQDGGAVEKKVTLEDQIVQTNPVLEAFGNAKTVRNNNSSRFGKFIRIHFNRAGRVASCDIEHYLLEKSRVIRQAPGERCYHIFYQIFSGQNPNLKKELKLMKPLSEYHFIAQAELTIDGVDDKEEFKLTDEAFNVLNFNAQEKAECYRVISAIVHMGNMKFKQRPREEQAEPDETEEAQFSADMFGVDCDVMLNALVKPRVRVGNEWVSKGQNVDQVNWGIGALAKALYARIFHWLVKKCNMTLDQKGLSRDSFIGVLDIAGFEIFDFNSFEQLWINFVNEKLQQFFNHHMFVLEQEEYAREGIAWTFIDFGLDLQACIELIEKPLGIISMLDEECIVPKASDHTLAQKLIEQHLGKHPNFEKPKPPKGKQAEAHFAMRHYAGTVRYNVTNWLEKNKGIFLHILLENFCKIEDPLNDTLVSVLKSAKSNSLLLEVWSDYQTQEEAAESAKSGGAKKKGKSGSFMTVSMIYRESLNNLMNMLNKTHPHFIRCIIPNEKKASGVIDAALVLNQLTCNGVLEGIRICRKGFPNRTMHKDFKVRYSILAANEARSSTDDKVACTNVLNKLVDTKKLEAEMFKVGHTKVFFKAGVLAHIEELRDTKMSEFITSFQCAVRYYLARCEYKRRKAAQDSFYIIQKNIRTWCVLRTWEWYLFYGKVKTQCCGKNKHAEEMEKLANELKELTETLEKQAETRKLVESEHAKIAEEKKKTQEELESLKKAENELEGQLSAQNSVKMETERRLGESKDRLYEQQQRSEETQRNLKRAQKEKESLGEQISNIQEGFEKVEEQKKKVDEQIREKHDKIAQQDEAIAALNREKKRFEEENRKAAELLEAESQKNAQTTRAKQKLEQAIDNIEDSLERERRQKMEIDKNRKKLESDLQTVQEQIDEMARRKSEVESRQQRADEELLELNNRLEDETAQIGRFQRQLKDQSSRLADLEEELENERATRAKFDKGKSSIQTQLDDLNDSINDEAGKAMAQMEINKKKETEILRLRQELEELNQRNENQLASLRKKNTETGGSLTERLEELQTARNKTEKEKENLRRQLDDVSSQIDDESRLRSEQERLLKNYEGQIAELQQRFDTQYKVIQDLQSTNQRFTTANVDFEMQLSDLEQQLTQTSKRKAQASAQLENEKRALEEEYQERMELSANVKSIKHELEEIREGIDEEVQQKEEILKQLSRAKAETQQWRAKFEGDGLIASDELEEERRRRMNKKLEINDTLAELNSKILAVEKANTKLVSDAEDARVDAERNRGQILHWEKKQKDFELAIEDFRKQCDELSAHIERTQDECRRYTAEVFAMQSATSSLTDQVDNLRRENKQLTMNTKDAQDQLSNSQRNVQDLTKKIRMLELEKGELQHILEEAEAALEIEENKVQRVEQEVSQIRIDIDRRIREKEEDFENTIKNHQRAIDSIRLSLENEQKSKQALLQLKKKLEIDTNDLELALDMANKINVETQKGIKKMVLQIQELQMQVEEEQRRREEQRDNFLSTEKKLTIAISENDSLTAESEQLDREKQRIELELQDQRAQKTDLQANVSQLTTLRRQIDGELHGTKSELDQALNELKQGDENAKKAQADADRILEELKQEQAHLEHIERIKNGYEAQLRELQMRLEQAEVTKQRNVQRTTDQQWQLIRTREHELDLEQKRHKDVGRQMNKLEHEMRELKFQFEEQKRSSVRMQDLIDKLQSKIKMHKKQIEEAYRQIQTALGDAEGRADEAENSLMRVRSRVRVNGSSTMNNIGGIGGRQMSSAAILRTSSSSHFMPK